jgi:HAD superfamily hydrolase (TIGR01509 family)
MGRYTAILFDLDGTLIDLAACTLDALRGALAASGLAIHDEQTWARVQAANLAAGDVYWGRRDAEGWTRAQVVEYVMRDTLAALGEGPERAAALADGYWDRFCRTAHLTPGAREALHRLRGHYRLGLVTNGERDSQRGRLQATGLDRFFEATIISGEVGCAKPDPRIFDLALAELGVSAAETLYVGDSIAHDCVGARSAGIDFCWVQPDVEARPEVQPTLRVRSLEALVDRLLVR